MRIDDDEDYGTVMDYYEDVEYYQPTEEEIEEYEREKTERYWERHG